MLQNITRLVCLWKPPQRAVDGKLLPDQCRIEGFHIDRREEDLIAVTLAVYEPQLDESVLISIEMTPELIAEKKSLLGLHIMQSLTNEFREAVAAHPTAAEACAVHRYVSRY